MTIVESLKEKQQREVAGTITATHLLGTIALWGRNVFYPFWLICITIHLYHALSNFVYFDWDRPKILIILHVTFYAILSPFYIVMGVYITLVMFIDIYFRKG